MSSKHSQELKIQLSWKHPALAHSRTVQATWSPYFEPSGHRKHT